MRAGRKGAGMGRAATVAAVVWVAGCSHLSPGHWPWQHAPPPPPAPVHELDISSSALDPAAIGQFWKRNTLVVDLAAVSGAGNLSLKPVAGTTWPVRLALRVTPGAIGLLEVHGEQRLSLPITASAGKPLDLELAPGVYTAKTAQITVGWGPSGSGAP